MDYQTAKIKVFISYAHEDETYCKKLIENLANLKRDNLIEVWHDREIKPGEKWELSIEKQINASTIFLLIISSSFLASDYCYENEFGKAIERQNANKDIAIIPIIVSPCDWENTLLRDLQALPKDALPVCEWAIEDNAYLNIVQELRKIIDNIRRQENGLPHFINPPTSTPVSQAFSPESTNTINPFPMEWTDVKSIWYPDIVISWFQENYAKNKPATMRELLSHIFTVIKNTNNNTIIQSIEDIGEKIKTLFVNNLSDLNEHHIRILELISLGLHYQHFHLFAMPQISLENLLEIPDYSTLLLATKYHTRGDYEEANNLLRNISSQCPLAKSLLGQGSRKLSQYNYAERYVEAGIEDMKNWRQHICPFNKTLNIICNESLIKSSLYRTLGVIRRNQETQGLIVDVEICYRKAEKALNLAWLSNNDSDPIDPESNDKTIISQFITNPDPNIALADIDFSHGYYLYNKGDYIRAKKYFQKSIKAIEKTEEQWDSPYTRLAIIQLLEGSYQVAYKTFSKASDICDETPISKNREAVLSKALCQLGLAILDELYEPNVTYSEPLEELKYAISLEPRLTKAPLTCHLDDAKHLLEIKNKNSEKLVREFIYTIQHEIDTIQ